MELFICNIWKDDRNPVAAVSTFLSYVVRCMSYLYISISLEICKASVHLPPTSVACLKLLQPTRSVQVCTGIASVSPLSLLSALEIYLTFWTAESTEKFEQIFALSSCFSKALKSP